MTQELYEAVTVIVSVYDGLTLLYSNTETFSFSDILKHGGDVLKFAGTRLLYINS